LKGLRGGRGEWSRGMGDLDWRRKKREGRLGRRADDGGNLGEEGVKTGTEGLSWGKVLPSKKKKKGGRAV